MERYDDLGMMGRGQYGSVYKVLLKAPAGSGIQGETLAMKRLPMASKKDAEAALREAELLHQLKHPNVIRYRESFVHDKQICIVMAFCDHGDLFTAIRKRREAAEEAGIPTRGFKERRVCTWFTQVAMGLDYVHSKRVLHRDLKTQNIFLARLPDGTMAMGGGSAGDDDQWVGIGAQLGDFGIARVLDGTDEMATTVAGTPYYMAPEICMNKPYTLHSDVWSLGCVLYELCSLQHAFAADSLLSLVYQIVRGEVPELPEEYSGELQAVVTTLLSREASERPNLASVLNTAFFAPYLPQGCYERPKTATRKSTSASGGRGMAAAAKGAKSRAKTPSSGSRPSTSTGARPASGRVAGSSRPSTALRPASGRAAASAAPAIVGVEDTAKLSTSERLRAKKIAEAKKREQELAEATRVQAAANADAKRRFQSEFHGSSVPLSGSDEARRHAAMARRQHEVDAMRAQQTQWEASRREAEEEQGVLDRLAGPNAATAGVEDEYEFDGFATGLSSSDAASSDVPLSPSSGGASLEHDTTFVPVPSPARSIDRLPPPPSSQAHVSPLDNTQRRAMTAQEYDERPLPRPGVRNYTPYDDDGGGAAGGLGTYYGGEHDDDAGVLMATVTRSTADLYVTEGMPRPTVPLHVSDPVDTVDTDPEYEDDFHSDDEEDGDPPATVQPAARAPSPISDDVRQNKSKRIEELRRRAISALGESDFKRVLNYMRERYNSGGSYDAKAVTAQLTEMVGKEKVNMCFLVDQLAFAESTGL
ncbi:serine/threonine-protein kinase Nek1 [Pseudoscourfieldia marina]